MLSRKILRKIEFLTTAPLSYVENTELLRDPTRQEISDSKTEAKLIEIDELGIKQLMNFSISTC